MHARRFLLLVLIIASIIAPIVVAFGFEGCTTQSKQSVFVKAKTITLATPMSTPTNFVTQPPTVTPIPATPTLVPPTPTQDPYKDMPKYKIKLDKKIQQYLWDKCKKNNWSYDLILAQLNLESNLDPNCKSYNSNGTTDCGLAQINNEPDNMKWYGEELAGIKKFDPFNPYHAIDACIAGMNFHRAYWKKQGITGENLVRYTLNTYNMGLGGFQKYLRNTGRSSRGYDREISRFKNQLQKNGRFDD